MENTETPMDELPRAWQLRDEFIATLSAASTRGPHTSQLAALIATELEWLVRQEAQARNEARFLVEGFARLTPDECAVALLAIQDGDPMTDAIVEAWAFTEASSGEPDDLVTDDADEESDVDDGSAQPSLFD